MSRIYNATPNVAINSALATILPSLTFTSVDLYQTKVTHALTYTLQRLGASRLQLLHRYLVVSAVVEETPSTVAAAIRLPVLLLLWLHQHHAEAGYMMQRKL